jgi:hypothetical protein
VYTFGVPLHVSPSFATVTCVHPAPTRAGVTTVIIVDE